MVLGVQKGVLIAETRDWGSERVGLRTARITGTAVSFTARFSLSKYSTVRYGYFLDSQRYGTGQKRP